jgi:hypothetical protein
MMCNNRPMTCNNQMTQVDRVPKDQVSQKVCHLSAAATISAKSARDTTMLDATICLYLIVNAIAIRYIQQSGQATQPGIPAQPGTVDQQPNQARSQHDLAE